MSTNYQTSKGPRWAGEPFRLFFPLGICAGIAGVMLWPLFFWGAFTIWPGVMHPRLMACGFGGAFVTGFLGTAWPRFMESGHLRAPEVLLLAGLWIGACVCWLRADLSAGDFLMACELSCLVAIMLSRTQAAAGMPPPGFLLALFSVSTTAGVLFWWALKPDSLTAWSWLFTRQWVWQGFLLLPLMGVGSYLFPRFFPAGAKHPGTRPASADVPPPLTSRAALRRKAGVFLPAILIVCSFALEASGASAPGNFLRAAALLLWLALVLPLSVLRKTTSTRAFALQTSLAAMLLSFVARAVWPQWPVTMEHLLFMGGFGLAVFLVADRVSLGHNDLLEKQPPRSWLWRWLLCLILLAAATRITADVVPPVMISHYIYAALLWTGVSLWWWLSHRRFPAPVKSKQPVPLSRDSTSAALTHELRN